MKKIIAIFGAIECVKVQRKFGGLPIWEYWSAFKHYYKWETSIKYRINYKYE